MLSNAELNQRFHQAVGIQKSSKLKKLVDPGLHRFVRRYSQRLLQRYTVVEADLFNGSRMYVALPEVISEAIYTYGYFDEEVTRVVLSQVHAGETVLDVGGHFGYFSCLMSSIVGSSGHVVAFEPTPSTFSILEKNSQRFAQMTAVNAAAGATPGTAQIKDYGLRYCAWNTLGDESKYEAVLGDTEPNAVTVKVIRLDDYVSEQGLKPSFIKIDTENFEWDVIQGLSGTVDTYHPRILMETGPNALKAGKFLLEKSYTAWKIRDSKLIQCTETLDSFNASTKDILYLPGQ